VRISFFIFLLQYISFSFSIHAIARDCHLVERNINDLVKVVETILSKCTEAMETMSKAVAQPRAEDGGVSGLCCAALSSFMSVVE